MRIVVATAFMLLSATASGQAKFGSWQYIAPSNQGDMRIAKTINDSNSTAGVICGETCTAYISIDLACDNDAKYPLMANSAIGANNFIGTCINIEKVPFLMLDNFDVAIGAFESGGEIGFAIPSANGKFRVLRFDGAGAAAAIRLARTIPAIKQSGTKNSSL